MESSTDAGDDAAQFEVEKLKLTIQISEKKLVKMQDLENKLKDMKQNNRQLEDELFKWKEESNKFESKSISLQAQIDDLVQEAKDRE